MTPSDHIRRMFGLAAADLTLLLTAAAGCATFFFVSLNLQQILGYRPLRAGVAFLPFSAGIATGATVARKLVPRIGIHVVPVIGLALATAGMIVLIQLPVHGRYASNLLPGLLALGLELGLTFVPITLAGTSEVSGEDAGLASGLLHTAQHVGGSIGLAILSTLARKPDDKPPPWPGPRAQTCGRATRSRRSSSRMRAVRTRGGHQHNRTPDQHIRQ